MADDPLSKVTKKFLEDLHEEANRRAEMKLLSPRMLAVTGVELAKRVPYETRVHIMTTVSYVVSQHEGVTPSDAAETFALLRSLLVPEKSPSWSEALINDGLVRTALDAGEKNYERTVEVLAKKEKESKKGLS